MPQQYPRPSGVADPNLQRLTTEQRQALGKWINGWDLERVDEDPFVEAVANAIWLYQMLKQLGDKTSAGAIRRNLDTAIADGKQFLKSLNALDGNSLQYLRTHTAGRNVRKEAGAVLRALIEVRLLVEKFPKRGPRPRPERVQCASLLLRALRTHTSAEPNSVPERIFESLLRYAFRLAGEKPSDLHNLAAKTLAAKLEILETDAVLSIASPE